MMKAFPMDKVVFFVTGNIHKFEEVRRVLFEYKISTALLKVDTIEIQDNDTEKIAKAKAKDAVKKCRLPIIIEDSGFFIKELNGFPGPYSSHTYRTIGTKGILKLMKKVKERTAFFHSVFVFYKPRGATKCFHGIVKGKISLEEHGRFGFGFDPIFKPEADGKKTFSEMSVDEKNKYSHRAQALRKFAEWYRSALSEGFKYHLSSS